MTAKEFRRQYNRSVATEICQRILNILLRILAVIAAGFEVFACGCAIIICPWTAFACVPLIGASVYAIVKIIWRK